MTDPFQPWERACLRILMWFGMAKGVVFAGTIAYAVAAAIL